MFPEDAYLVIALLAALAALLIVCVWF